MQSSYVSILDDRLKPLGYFADQILQSTNDYDVFRILCFQEKSAQLAIFQSFFSEIESNTMDLKDSTTGNNSTKFLERIGLVQELKSAFIEKTTTYTVTFRGKRVELNFLASIDQVKLIQQIDILPIKGNPL